MRWVLDMVCSRKPKVRKGRSIFQDQNLVVLVFTEQGLERIDLTDEGVAITAIGIQTRQAHMQFDIARLKCQLLMQHLLHFTQ